MHDIGVYLKWSYFRFTYTPTMMTLEYKNKSVPEMALLRGAIAEKEGIDVQQLYNGFNRQLGWALQ